MRELPNLIGAHIGRPVVCGTHGIVSSGHYLTSIAAMRMLLSGGNAFDGAVAAGFAAAVLEPTAPYSLAAEGSILVYHAASKQLRALSGQGVAAGRATVEFFKSKGHDKIPTGPGPDAGLSFTVPGIVDAYILLLQTYGTKPLAEILAPAIDFAHHGFPMYSFMYHMLGSRRTIDQFTNFSPAALDIFYPGGERPEMGQMVVQKNLANTLQRLVDAEREAGGDRLTGLQAARDEFYRGSLAKTIVECSDRAGGLLSLEDLANHRAVFEEPLRTTFMGYEVCAQSTWTQGAVLLQSLNILEHFDLQSMGHNTPQYIHTLVETIKLAFADRERYYGDPNFAEVPIDGLVSKGYAADRAKLVQAGTASPGLPEAGDPWKHSNMTPSSMGGGPVTSQPQRERGPQDERGTTHLAVIDREGNMVCATPSGAAFAKSVYFPELGCALSTRSEMFFLDDDHPNGLKPGKRPRTTLVNYMLCKDGEPVMTVGCPGGDNQAQADLQLILNVLVFGMDPQQAVEAPRFASQSVTNSFYPRTYLPGHLDVEAAIPQDTRTKLSELGHKVGEFDPCGYGAVVSQRDPSTGVLSAGADPRSASYAIGW